MNSQQKFIEAITQETDSARQVRLIADEMREIDYRDTALEAWQRASAQQQST